MKLQYWTETQLTSSNGCIKNRWSMQAHTENTHHRTVCVSIALNAAPITSLCVTEIYAHRFTYFFHLRLADWQTDKPTLAHTHCGIWCGPIRMRMKKHLNKVRWAVPTIFVSSLFWGKNSFSRFNWNKSTQNWWIACFIFVSMERIMQIYLNAQLWISI